MDIDLNNINRLWDKYNLPEYKRNHCRLVARVVWAIVNKFKIQNSKFKINEKLLIEAALLHDIDKNIPKLPGETHPDAGVRVLRDEGLDGIADLVASHPLHLIIDSKTAPKTWDEKILFLSDKTVKDRIITVDERFRLWRNEPAGNDFKDILDKSYPLVKKLEAEVFGIIGTSPQKLFGLID